MRTANPALNTSTFDKFDVYESSQTMTLEGTATRTGILLVLAVGTAAFSWNQFEAVGQAAMPWLFGGLIGGLILAIVTVFKQQWAPVTAPLYALAEGLFLGVISAMYNLMFYPGIVLQAVCLTFGTLFMMLVAYRTGWIRATEKFKMGVVAATGAVFLVYVISWIMSFFVAGNPLWASGPIGIGFSLVVVVIAALNLVLDFDFIDQGVARGAPKYMEWYGAFGLMVTLVWLYIEILRLLSKLNSRD